MVRKLVAFALYQPLFLLLVTLLFVGAGIVAFRSLPVEAFPDVTDVQATVITLVPGHAAEEVEKQVTIPLEIVLAGVPHAVRMFSHTQFGLSFLTLTFDDQVDDYFARQRVLERLQQADLPPDIQPQLAPLSTPVGELYRFRLVSDDASPTELRSIEDWVVERQLKMAPGVADVVSRGGFIKQYQVNLDLARMKAYGVVLQQVFTALGRGNVNAGGNYLEQGEQQYLIRGVGLLRSPEDIGTIVVAEHGGTPLLIRDIARRPGRRRAPSGPGRAKRRRRDRRGHRPDAQGREPVGGADRGQSTRRAPERVDSAKGRTDRVVLRPLDAHPDDVDDGVSEPAGGRASGDAGAVRVSAQRARRRNRCGRDSAGAARDLHRPARPRHPGQPAVARRHGFRDHRRRRGHRRRERFPDARRIRARRGIASSVRQAILDATAQVGRPTLFSMLIIIVAHIPIFTLQRHEGRIFAPMAYTVTSALVGSLVFSLTLVPLLCLFLLGRGVAHERNRLVEGLTRLYRRLLTRALRRPLFVVGSAAAALIAALLLVPKLGTEFLPELNEGTLWLNLTLPPSVSVSEASRIVARVRTVLRRFPEVTQVISQAGRPEDGTDPKTDQHVRVLRGSEAAGGMDPEDHAATSCRPRWKTPSTRFRVWSRRSLSRFATTCSRAFRRSTARS